MHYIHQILLALWRARVAEFLPIWFTLTAVVALLTAWFVGRAASAPVRQEGGISPNCGAGSPARWSLGSRLIIACFALFVGCYVALIFAWNDFAYYDGSQFTLYSLQNLDFAPPIWPDAGRFFPLDCQEFNLVRHLSTSITAYHALPVVQLLAVCFLLLILNSEFNIKVRVFLALSVLVVPGMVISFEGLIYPERNVVLWLLLMAYFVRKFDQTQSASAASLAVICAQFMLYYKETAFLLLWGFAAGRLLLRCRTSGPAGWDWSRFRLKESVLDVCLASLGMLFLTYFAAVMLRHSHLDYAQKSRLPELRVLLLYLKQDLLAWVLSVFVACRAYLLFRGRVTPLPLWDGLAYGAMAYFAGFLLLGMVSAYYLAPVDVIAVLFLGRLFLGRWERLSLAYKTIGIVLCGLITFQNVSHSAYRIYERKNLIEAKEKVADCIVEWRRNDGGGRTRLFFPFASTYVTMEFGAYLHYRGLPVEMDGSGGTQTNCVSLVCRALPKDGLLQSYRVVIGHAGVKPLPGDLIVILPDDNAAFSAIAPYRDGGKVLLSYDPSPRLPVWSWSLVRLLNFSYPTLFAIPDHWLSSTVTLCNGG